MVEALSARAMVEETTKRITLVLLDKERSKEKKRDDFESIMMGRLDIHLISKLVMGNNWVEFSSDEKQVFRNRFEKYLVQSYWNVVEGHAFIDISVEGIKQFVRNGRPEKREWVVSTLITREGKPDETVGLRVRRTTPSGDKPGDWKIIDMIDRLGSRISVHKGDLDSVFTEHGTKGVLKELAQKIRPH